MHRILLSSLVTSSSLIALSVAGSASAQTATAQTATGQTLPAADAPPAKAVTAEAVLPAPTARTVPTKPVSAPAREWYGMPIVVTDIAAVSMMLLGLQSDSAGLALLGVSTYALGGPVIHFVEGRSAAGFGSLGVRVGAPLLGGMVGGKMGAEWSGGCEGEWCGLRRAAGGALIGIGLGAAAAIVVDHAVLAYKPAKLPQVALSITPTYIPTTGEAGIAVSGRW